MSTPTRIQNLQKDKCANPYCNRQILYNEFYCDWCSKRMKNSVYGDYN